MRFILERRPGSLLSQGRRQKSTITLTGSQSKRHVYLLQLLVWSLVSMVPVQAKETITNKTFMTPRSQSVNFAIKSTPGLEDLNYNAEGALCKNRLQAAVFFQSIMNKEELGQYYGIKRCDRITMGAVTLVGDPLPEVTKQAFDILFIVHKHNNDTDSLDSSDFPENAATIKIAPYQKSYGVYLNYYRRLCFLPDGFFLQIDIPCVRVENEIDFMALGSRFNRAQNFFAGKLQTPQVVVAGVSTVADAQDPLRNALMSSERTIEIGIADLDSKFGYAFYENNHHALSVNVGFTLPTGNKARGQYVFEAMLGNGGHYALGVGADGWLRFRGDAWNNWKAFFNVDYRYLFSGKDVRTIGLKKHNFGQYHLLGSILDGENNRAIPAANVLTRCVDVTPGSQINMVFGVDWRWNNLAFDLGYELYAKAEERVRLRAGFPEKTYGVLARNYDFTTGNFTGDPTQIDKGAGLLTCSDLDVAAAATPSQMTHKIFVGGSHLTSDWDIPVLLAIGGHMEFASDNAAFETWGVHAKIGSKF